MNEWSFCTAHTDGTIVSIDGHLPKETAQTVRDLCTGEGWDVDHASLDSGADCTYWRLILSRPFAPRPADFRPAFDFSQISGYGDSCDGRR